VNIIIAFDNHHECGKVAKRISNDLTLKKIKNTLFEIVPKNLKEKNEKKIVFNKLPEIKSADLLIVGTSVKNFSSHRNVNAFIRALKPIKNLKACFYSTGIILGTELKKMSSIASMKGITTIESIGFTSIFEFDENKLKEVDEFVEKILEKKNLKTTKK
jgi:hypothetical protein